MSTKDLALTCLKYPLISTMYAYNDLQAGFNALLSKFNGFEILINRKDAGEVLLSMYKGMSVSSLDLDSDPVAQGRFTFEFTYIEIILGQRTVLANLNEGKRKELIREALRKYDDKLRLQSVFGSHGTSISAWVMGRCLNQELIIPANSGNNISNAELAKYAFLEQAVVADMRVVEGIVNQARQFVK